jgi:hypothetical protein
VIGYRYTWYPTLAINYISTQENTGIEWYKYRVGQENTGIEWYKYRVSSSTTPFYLYLEKNYQRNVYLESDSINYQRLVQYAF